MTNRMILNDTQLGRMPKTVRDWTFVQRQLAEDTAPGFSSVVLLDDVVTTATTTTLTTVADKNSVPLSISLKLGVKYYISVFGSYNREDTNDVQFQLAFSGVAAGTPEDTAFWHFHSVTTGAERTDSSKATLGLAQMTSTVGDGYTFGLEGFINVDDTAGELTMEFAENSAGVDATLYAGTRLIAQPIINLSDRGNP